MTAVVSNPRPAVSVDELQRAWGAVQEGQFRRNGTHARAEALGEPESARASDVWRRAPAEQTIAVVGAAGSVGASTVSLALGIADPGPVRVVECCPAIASGLAAASTAEFGLHPAGWRQGTRKHVLLERTGLALTRIEDVPTPTAANDARQLTILDIGWPPETLLSSDCWLSADTASADALVVVATATVPGLRRLEAALELVDHDRAQVALTGFRRRKWPKGVEASAGPRTRRVLAEQRYVCIDEDRALAISGVDSRPLPDPLLRAAGHLHGACMAVEAGAGDRCMRKEPSQCE